MLFYILLVASSNTRSESAFENWDYLKILMCLISKTLLINVTGAAYLSRYLFDILTVLCLSGLLSGHFVGELEIRISGKTGALELKEYVLHFQDSPLLSLLGQTSSLSWHLVDIASYQSVLSYFSSHYQPSILLAKESSADLIVKLLKVTAGLSVPTDSQKHLVS